MIRRLCLLLIVAVLCMSVDAAIDIVQSGHPHDDDVASQRDAPFDQSGALAKARQHTGERSGSGHCDHCCHGHTPAVADGSLELPTGCATAHPFTYAPVSIANFAQAPPTPPPNA